MTSKNKKISIIFLFGSLFLALFFVFGNNENYEQKKDLLQSAVDQYIEENDCYPTQREVSFGNPSPINFQKIYTLLPSKFEFDEDLYYWISLDGQVWLSKTDPPTIEKTEENLIYDRQGRLHYYLYYYEDGQLKKEETREKEIPLDYAISESYGDGLATPPITDEYEGYEKHNPIITIKNEKDSLNLFSLIEEGTSPDNGLLATIGNVFKKKKWIEEYGFDIYGEEIVEGKYEEGNSLGKVKIKTEDGRESLWVNLDNPTDFGACYQTDNEIINQEIVVVEKPGFFSFLNPNSNDKDTDKEEMTETNQNDSQEPIYQSPEEPTTTYKSYNTREVTIKGGPKNNNNFKEVISFTTTDGFSGLLYKHGEVLTQKEEKVIYDYRLSEENNFPETVQYSKDKDQKLKLQFVEKIEGEYMAFYEGTSEINLYYQLYKGILRK